MVHKEANVVIIGSGPAGYSAAIYCARANLQPVLISGLQQGGQLTITTDVENYPGFAEPISGPFLMDEMQKQALNMGTQFIYDSVVATDLTKPPFSITLDSGDIISAKSLIIATGAQARWLGLESEQKFMGAGVSACATCDGFFFKGKDVVVIGGGNSAVEEALYLSHIANKVTIIHRKDRLRAERIMQERLMARENISFIWNHKVEEILGARDENNIETVSAVAIEDVLTGKIRTVNCDGVFVAIGHIPAVDIFANQLKLKESGTIWTKPDSTATNIAGVFAAGDVADDNFRQAITAAGFGCMAALEVERYLDDQDRQSKTNHII